MDRSAKTFVMTSLLLWVAVLGGCSRYLSDAQDHFSRAAAEETRLFGAGLAADGGLVRQTSAATDYRLALALLDRELSENEGRLRDERLYGTALMLKALCLWRLADLDAVGDGPLADELAASLATIRAEQRRHAITLGERDRALLIALPGLRDHDRGLRAADYPTARRFFESALAVLDRALTAAAVPETHPVRVYLRLAQLSTCRAWQTAAYHFLAPNEADAEVRTPTDRARSILEKLKPLGERDETTRRQIAQMAARLGLDAR